MKNKAYTKLLDYDSLMHYLQNVDYDPHDRFDGIVT